MPPRSMLFSALPFALCMLLRALRAHHPGTWRKVYRRGRDGTEIHYFEHRRTGKVWGIKVK